MATYDDRWILSGSADACVRLWDPNTGKCRTILKGHEDGVSSIAADPTGRTFATAGKDMKMRLWRCKEVDEVAHARARRSGVHSLLT
jgi:WD40 repeat protein